MTNLRLPAVLVFLAAIVAAGETYFVALDQGDHAIVVNAKTGKTKRESSWSQKETASAMASGGRKLMVNAIDGTRRVYSRKNNKTREVARNERACREVVAHPSHGWIAYTVEAPTQRRMKYIPRSIFLRDLDSGKEIELSKSVFFREFAWSPNGKILAISLDQSVLFVDQSGKTLRTVTSESIDKRLYAHGAYHLKWRPDSAAVACSIQFLGGRAAMPGAEPKPLYGDHELFIVPVTGDVVAHSLKPDVRVKPAGWVKVRVKKLTPKRR